MRHYPHHISDFNNATRHLTRVERSVYRDAIELYYDKEQMLTLNLDKLERKLLCVNEEEKKALKVVLTEFFIKCDDGFYHDRCDVEITKYNANTSAKAKAGKASAAARKLKLLIVQQNSKEFNRCSTGVQQNLTNHQPSTINHQPILKEKDKKKTVSEELPTQDLVPQELWDSFLTIRKKAKAINSPQAIKSLITELNKLKSHGHDPCDVVNQSIRSSWKDVYPIKNNSSNSKNEKFDPVAYVNRKRIRGEDESSRIIDIQ